MRLPSIFLNLIKFVPLRSYFVCIQVSVKFKALRFEFLAAKIAHTVEGDDS